MTEDSITTNVQLENGSPAFAKPVLYEVPTYLAECPIETINRKIKRKKAMEELKIYKFQAKHIEDTFRLVCNRLNSIDKKTSLDRDIMQAWEMIENVLNNKITEPVNR